MTPNPTLALIFIQAEPLSEMQQAAALLEKEGGIRTFYEDDPQNALLLLKEQPATLIVYSIKTAEDLKHLLKFSSDISPLLKAGSACLTVLNQINHPEIHKILKKMGCSDVFEAGIKPKALRLKLNRHFQPLRQIAVRAAAPLSLASTPTELLKDEKPAVQEVEALIHPSDCWILNAKTIKRLQGKWIFTVMGPGPRFGRWVSANSAASADRSSDQDSEWIWTPAAADGTDDFILSESDSIPVQWRFRGRKPELSQMLWSMVGDRPELVLLKEGKPVARRFHVDTRGTFLLAANSRQALSRIGKIKAGFEFEIRLQGEKKPKAPEMDLKLDELFSAQLDLMLSPEAQRAWNQGDARKEEPAPSRNWNFERASTPDKARFFEKTEPLLAPKAEMFELIDSRITEKSYLQEAADTACTVTIWTREQKFRQESRMKAFDDSSTSITIENPVILDGTPFEELLKKLAADQVYFNINVARGTLFFAQQCEAIAFQPEHFQLKVPPSLYEVQRRTHFRLSLKPTNPSTRLISIRLGLEDHSDGKTGTPYTLINISRGGACLEIPPGLRKRFQIGDVLPNVTLQLYKTEMRCSAQVRWSHSGVFGIQFIKMPAYESETLHLFVMEESYEYLANYVNPSEK